MKGNTRPPLKPRAHTFALKCSKLSITTLRYSEIKLTRCDKVCPTKLMSALKCVAYFQRTRTSLQYLPVSSDLLLLSIHETLKLENFVFFLRAPLGPLVDYILLPWGNVVHHDGSHENDYSSFPQHVKVESI